MQFSWKKSLLVICKILGLFVKTLTADGKYSLLSYARLNSHCEAWSYKKKSIKKATRYRTSV